MLPRCQVFCLRALTPSLTRMLVVLCASAVPCVLLTRAYALLFSYVLLTRSEDDVEKAASSAPVFVMFLLTRNSVSDRHCISKTNVYAPP